MLPISFACSRVRTGEDQVQSQRVRYVRDGVCNCRGQQHLVEDVPVMLELECSQRLMIEKVAELRRGHVMSRLLSAF